MNISPDSRRAAPNRYGERGEARLKLVVLLVVIAALAYVGYQYVPVAYQESLYKVYMQDTVDKAAVLNKPASWVEEQLRAGVAEYGVPADAVFKVEKRDNRLEANARWMRSIPLPGYIYQYNFDHTVKSSGFVK